jgi:hypothetical protein
VEEALQVLNELEAQGLMARYAIGGGMAAVYYVEPILTLDLDVFYIPPDADATIIDLGPIYAYLAERGYRADAEHILIGGMSVQLLAAYSPLVEEAVHEAHDIEFGHTPTRVVRAEHLVAVMLDTGRPKDLERLFLMLDEAELDAAYLQDVLSRHDLLTRWEELRRRFDR